MDFKECLVLYSNEEVLTCGPLNIENKTREDLICIAINLLSYNIVNYNNSAITSNPPSDIESIGPTIQRQIIKYKTS